MRGVRRAERGDHRGPLTHAHPGGLRPFRGAVRGREGAYRRQDHGDSGGARGDRHQTAPPRTLHQRWEARAACPHTPCERRVRQPLRRLDHPRGHRGVDSQRESGRRRRLRPGRDAPRCAHPPHAAGQAPVRRTRTQGGHRHDGDGVQRDGGAGVRVGHRPGCPPGDGVVTPQAGGRLLPRGHDRLRRGVRRRLRPLHRDEQGEDRRAVHARNPDASRLRRRQRGARGGSPPVRGQRRYPLPDRRRHRRRRTAVVRPRPHRGVGEVVRRGCRVRRGDAGARGPRPPPNSPCMDGRRDVGGV